MIHIVPIDDLREHIEADDGSCWCEPKPIREDGIVIWVHRAEDGRELVEEHGVN